MHEVDLFYHSSRPREVETLRMVSEYVEELGREYVLTSHDLDGQPELAEQLVDEFETTPVLIVDRDTVVAGAPGSIEQLRRTLGDRNGG